MVGTLFRAGTRTDKIVQDKIGPGDVSGMSQNLDKKGVQN